MLRRSVLQMQLFQRSFSTKGQGRGIGTYSIKLLTEDYLHGEVNFISNPGDGTVFSVVLNKVFSADEKTDKAIVKGEHED